MAVPITYGCHVVRLDNAHGNDPPGTVRVTLYSEYAAQANEVVTFVSASVAQSYIPGTNVTFKITPD